MSGVFCDCMQVHITLTVSHITPTRCPYLHQFTTCFAKSIVFSFSRCTDKVFEGFIMLPLSQPYTCQNTFVSSVAVSPWLRNSTLPVRTERLHIRSKAPNMHQVGIVIFWNVSTKVYQQNCGHRFFITFLKNCSFFWVLLQKLKSSKIA